MRAGTSQGDASMIASGALWSWGACPVQTSCARAEAGCHCGHHALHFVPLTEAEPELVFGCDEQGHVDLDALSDCERENYLYARAMLGKHYHRPHCEAVPEGPPPTDRAGR